MGKNILHMSDTGAGQEARLCNDMAIGVIMPVAGETMALDVAHGLAANAPSRMMALSTGCNWATEMCNPWRRACAAMARKADGQARIKYLQSAYSMP